MSHHGASERRACRVLAFHRSTHAAADRAASLAEVRAFLSTRVDEKAESHFSLSFEIEEAGQFFPSGGSGATLRMRCGIAL